MKREVFWLVPAAEFRKPLLALIADLASAHDAPVFAPHLTLGAVRRGDRSTSHALRKRLEESAPVQLEITRMETGSEFTHSLFLSFAPSETLVELMQAFPLPAGHAPHLSLLYCAPERHKASACEALELPFPIIVFDQAWVVPMTGVVRTAEDVTGWQATDRIRLRG